MKVSVLLIAVALQAQQSTNLYTLEKERALGQQIASEIRTRTTPIEDPVAKAYVEGIGKKLLAHLPDQPFAYQFDVIDGESLSEPASLPGGIVLIPVRWLLAVQEESEVTRMLAHSIGHIALRHGTRQATRTQSENLASVPLIFMGGWMGLHTGASDGMLVPAGFLPMQRAYEEEAVAFAAALMARAEVVSVSSPEELRHVQESLRSVAVPKERRPPTLRR